MRKQRVLLINAVRSVCSRVKFRLLDRDHDAHVALERGHNPCYGGLYRDHDF
jgi:hypothetical protein